MSRELLDSGIEIEGKEVAVLIDFFLKLKSHKLPVSIKEYLTLLEAMGKGVIGLDRRVLLSLARGAGEGRGELRQVRPRLLGVLAGCGDHSRHRGADSARWLLKQVELHRQEEEKKQIQALGGWEKLMETLKKRLEEQKGRHQGGAEMDRNRRLLALRRVRLQPGRRTHRPGEIAQQERGQGVGPARVPQPGRLGRARHAQHQSGLRRLRKFAREGARTNSICTPRSMKRRENLSRYPHASAATPSRC